MQPSSKLVLLRGVPLSNTYTMSTIYESREGQYADFMSYPHIELENLSYQRFNENIIRIDRNVEEVYDVNYIIFSNDAYSLDFVRYFYAFVTDVEYINDNTTAIHYEIDVIQTWMFDYEFGDCLIEREHVADDTVGKHVLGEGFNIGEYVITNKTELKGENLIYCAYISDIEGTNMKGVGGIEPPKVRGAVPVSCYSIALGLGPAAVPKLKELVDAAGKDGKLDSIVCVFGVPQQFASPNDSIKSQELAIAGKALTFTPKNNKMYTYPYCYATIEGGNERKTLLYEKMGQGCVLSILGGFGPNMTVVGIPTFYDNTTVYMDGAVTCSGYPMLAWVGNYYQNWLAQKTPHYQARAFTSVAKAATSAVGASVVGGIPGAIAGGVMSLANDIVNVWQEDATAQMIPDKLSGSVNATDILATTGQLGFRTYCMSVRADVGQAIDDFFTMYGYKVQRLGKPHLMQRPNFNYIKMANTVLLGTLNNNDFESIQRIYSNGICFWKQLSKVGNYTINNK